MLIAFVILNGSKESGIAISGILLFTIMILNRKGIKNLASTFPFLVIFIFSFLKSYFEYQKGGYGVVQVNNELIKANFDWYFSQLLFLKINPFFPIFLITPVVLGIGFTANNLRHYLTRKRGKSPILQRLLLDEYDELSWKRSVFSAIVFLSLIGSFLLLLSSAGFALRYLYPSVYLLTILIAIGFVELSLRLGNKQKWINWVVVMGCFYFIWANYYNFVYQFADQYYTRNNEANMLNTVTNLLKQNKTVYVIIGSEYEEKIQDYFKSYLPYFRGIKYDNIHFVTRADVYDDSIYYLTQDANPLGGHELQVKHKTTRDPPFLTLLKKLSSFAMMGAEPPVIIDNGVAPLGEGQWFIYKNLVTRKMIENGKLLNRTEHPINLGIDLDENDINIPLDLELSIDHYYIIKLKYSTSGNARPFVIISATPYDPNNISMQQLIPLSEKVISVALVFKPPLRNVTHPNLIFRNWTTTGAFHIVGYDIYDLGEIEPGQ
jgi:hypothetical protein